MFCKLIYQLVSSSLATNATAEPSSSPNSQMMANDETGNDTDTIVT